MDLWHQPLQTFPQKKRRALQFLKEWWATIDANKVPTLDDLCNHHVLVVAAKANRVNVCRFLRDECGLLPDLVHLEDIRQTLNAVASDGNMDMLKFLKEWATWAHVRPYFGQAMLKACKNGHVDVMYFLMEWSSGTGRQPSIKDISFSDIHKANKKTTALDIARMAGQYGDVEVLKFLKTFGMTFRDMDAGAERENACCSEKEWRLTLHNCALRQASFYDHVHVLNFFEKWAEKEAVDFLAILRRDKVLTFAAQYGCMSVLQFLRNYTQSDGPEGVARFTFDDIREDNFKALYNAATGGHVETFKVLMNWEADKCALTLRSLPLVIFQDAASFGRVDMLKCLKEWRDPDGFCLTLDDVRADKNNALFHAAVNNNKEACAFLKAWGLTNADAAECLWHCRQMTSLYSMKVHTTLHGLFDYTL